MQYSAKAINAQKDRSDCLIVTLSNGGKLSPAAEALEKNGANLAALCKREGFHGKEGETLLLHSPTGTQAQRLLLLGIGAEKPGAAGFVRALGKALDALKNTPCKSLAFMLGEVDVEARDTRWQALQLAQALEASQYQFTRCKSKPTKNVFKPTKAVFGCAGQKQLADADAGLKEGSAIGRGANLTRELADLPANICTPSYLATEARRLGRKQPKLTVKVLEEKQMKELGMGALLSVSAGSDQPAKLIVMEYRGAAKSQAPFALVGKGITFDTGGISLKPGPGMDEMKYDMGGAASVFGCVQTLLELQPKINVVAVVAASENMPNGRATKPGDVVTSMSGQTIEVLNTDAEGRLVLCDALTYVERYKPQSVVDIATLTGACIVALGSQASGLFSNQDELAEALLSAGETSGDRAWRLPLWDEYQKQLDSNFADMANIGGKEAGSVTAACFLSRYADKYPWAHLDVAGTAWRTGAAKGATGRPVPLLMHYLLQQGS
ncbi:leucyl aminopeptidase [Marinimicrobium sp. C2-29]|uniref:leucyl aminopeptidase n=1 Tax=Marinimicrobium sp. C2-29 TaxID=3139825 RepID=UPI0031395A1B